MFTAFLDPPCPSSLLQYFPQVNVETLCRGTPVPQLPDQQRLLWNIAVRDRSSNAKSDASNLSRPNRRWLLMGSISVVGTNHLVLLKLQVDSFAQLNALSSLPHSSQTYWSKNDNHPAGKQKNELNEWKRNVCVVQANVLERWSVHVSQWNMYLTRTFMPQRFGQSETLFEYHTPGTRHELIDGLLHLFHQGSARRVGLVDWSSQKESKVEGSVGTLQNTLDSRLLNARSRSQFTGTG